MSPFQTIFNVLKTTRSTLPDEVAELCTQSKDVYNRFFKEITFTEQAALNACRQRANEACRKLQRLDKKSPPEVAKSLSSLAIANILEIRGFQLLFILFQGTAG